MVPVQGIVPVSADAGGDGRASILTLGGLRPGSVYCVVPGIPQLEWKSCLTRDDDRKGSHVSYLASTDEASLYCPRCQPYDRQEFVALTERARAAVATGKNVDVLTDHPFAKLLLRASIRRWRDTSRGQAPLDVHSDAASASSPPGARDVSERSGSSPDASTTVRDWCCPRVTLGHGLHSPTCKNFLDTGGERGSRQPAPHDEQQGAATPDQRASVAVGNVVEPHPSPIRRHRASEPPVSNFPIERDDPKAEVGSFERTMPWRPKYRDKADWEEWRHERAAIFEYLGGHDRKAAEFAANKLAGPPP